MSKLKALQDNGIDPYPVGQPPSRTVASALQGDDDTAVTVAGRVLRIRDYGGVLFAQLRDWSAEVQLYWIIHCWRPVRRPTSPAPSIWVTSSQCPGRWATAGRAPGRCSCTAGG